MGASQAGRCRQGCVGVAGLPRGSPLSRGWAAPTRYWGGGGCEAGPGHPHCAPARRHPQHRDSWDSGTSSWPPWWPCPTGGWRRHNHQHWVAVCSKSGQPDPWACSRSWIPDPPSDQGVGRGAKQAQVGPALLSPPSPVSHSLRRQDTLVWGFWTVTQCSHPLPVTATYLNTHTLTMLLRRLQGQGPFLPLPTQPQWLLGPSADRPPASALQPRATS